MIFLVKNYNNLAKNINNKISKLEKKMEKEILIELIKTAEETVEKLKLFLDKNWYNTYYPVDYKRTYSLKKSIRYTLKKNKIKIYFDKRYFVTREENNGEGWQPHRGFDGQIFITGLIDFLNDGTGNGGVKTNPRRFDGNIDILGYAEEIINDYLDNIVNKKIKIIMKKYL